MSIRSLLQTGAMMLAAATAQAATVVYVSNADSQDISVLSLDQTTGALTAIETVPVGGMVMPLAVSPDKHRLYATLRSQPYRVISFEIDAASGRLHKLGEASLADSMANIDVDQTGRWLFAASYGGNKITVNSIDKNGVVGSVQQLLPTKPNAHAIHVDAANRFVFATSLGGDELTSWRFDSTTGHLSPNRPAAIPVEAGSGPRHFVWDTMQRRVYAVCELSGALYAFDYDPTQGSLREVQRTSVLPPDFRGKPAAADLHLAPDGHHLYASERTSNTLAVFDVDPANGLLKPVAHVATEASPRGFGIEPSGHYLIAAGQNSNAIAVYAIDPASGALEPRQRYTVGKNPNWVQIVDLP